MGVTEIWLNLNQNPFYYLMDIVDYTHMLRSQLKLKHLNEFLNVYIRQIGIVQDQVKTLERLLRYLTSKATMLSAHTVYQCHRFTI